MKKFFTLIMMVVAFSMSSYAATYLVVGSPIVCNEENWNINSTANVMGTSDGGATYTLTVSNATLEASTNYEYKIVEKGSWTEYWPNTGINASFSVSENGVYDILYTYTVSTAKCEVTTTKTGSAGEVTHTYSIAGKQADIFGASWSETNTSTEMTLNTETGLYEWTSGEFSVSGEAMTIEFKVVRDHGWAVAYPSQNKQVTAPVGGPYTLTVTFDATTQAVNATLNSATPITHIYSIAGDPESVFGASWSETNTSTEMTLNTETGLYEWTSGEFSVENQALAIGFKVVVDHAWGEAYPSDNYTLTAPVGGPYTLTVTFNAESKAVNAELNSETVITNTYSVAGSDATLFGASWSATETSTEMTEGESGVYSWTSGNFNQAADGFIEFKVIENHSWDSAYPSGDNQYVFVPAGGPYTLTVTYNTNGNAVSGTVNGADVAYSVVGGSTDILGGDWNVKNLSTKMTLGTDGLYRWTSAEFNQAEDGSISFKVAKNFSWGEAYPADNYNLNLPAGGPYTLTVTFNPNGNAVGAVLNGAHSYVVAGEPVEAFGSEWDINNTNNTLVHQGNGIYTLNVTYKPASSNSAPAKDQNVRKRAEGDMTTIKFKVVEDGNWDNAYPADNYTMEVPTDQESNIAITFDAASKGISAASEIVTGVNDLNADKAVAGVKYYNLLGVESAEPFQGVNVVVTTYADGSKQATKVVR